MPLVLLPSLECLQMGGTVSSFFVLSQVLFSEFHTCRTHVSFLLLVHTHELAVSGVRRKGRIRMEWCVCVVHQNFSIMHAKRKRKGGGDDEGRAVVECVCHCVCVFGGGYRRRLPCEKLFVKRCRSYSTSRLEGNVRLIEAD